MTMLPRHSCNLLLYLGFRIVMVFFSSQSDKRGLITPMVRDLILVSDRGKIA